MSASPNPSTRPRKTTGLRYWMMQVLEECDNVSADFSPDHVHDLRVSLRRCRSLADGLMAIHPDPEWKAMRKAGKRLFQRLGDLRDIHVMEEWVEKLEKLSAKTGSKKADEEGPRVEVGDSPVLLASPQNPGSAAQSDSD